MMTIQGFPDRTRTVTLEPDIAYRSELMTEVRATAVRVAAGSVKVLITGESGVGKDVLARLIHARSPRASKPFVAVNCAALSDTLLESELFGHVKGSFTGAFRDKPGKLQAAHQGTIFLDEIGEMTLRMQALLLRFLETGELQTVGEDGTPRRVDVRLVAATNRDLDAMVSEGTFRQDLLYRLRVVHLHVPPLRERPEDVRPLVTCILRRTGSPLSFTEAAMHALEGYGWPGNVRELQNLIEQLLWTTGGSEVDIRDLPAAMRSPCTPAVDPAVRRERRRQVSDDLFAALRAGHYTFWDHVHPLFLERDITRHDLRQLVRLGLAETRGNYRSLLELFHIDAAHYKRFLAFLAAHDCMVDYREFRPSMRVAAFAAERGGADVEVAPRASRVSGSGGVES